MQYMVRTLEENTVIAEEGPYYLEAKAESTAKKLSRQLTSTSITVQLACVDVDGNTVKARTYRMGKLYRP